MVNIVLVHPQIPPNTGNIGRLCVNIGATLHLVRPLGFDLSQKQLRRAGLDYWDKLDYRLWDDMDLLLASVPAEANCYFATTKTKRNYFEPAYQKGDYLFFGSETQGLDAALLQRYENSCVTIPMTKQGRSLNLSVSAGIIAYEALRQNYHLL